MADAGAERRLAAIVAIDVAGYSRLMGADEQGTLAALKGHREAATPIVEGHGGRLVGTAGDALLLEFPSVVEAVTSAIEVQALMAERNGDVPEKQKMLFRIGINLGDVLVDGDDIYGDGVNIAARLEGLAEPGGIAISDIVRGQVHDKLGVTFADDGAHQVKNIREAVHVWRWPAKEPLSPPAAAGVGDKAAAPSIAVLPFDNMSGDESQEYFSDGLSEDIITELSRYGYFHVIARNSTFAYKGRSVDVQTIASELGARYVLEGSVRKAGNRVRITTQFIDGASGNHLWAERYDRDLEDIFEVQDEITRTIASTLGVKIFEDSTTRASNRKPSDINAYDLIMKAWAHFMRFNRQDNQEARRLAENAKDLAPDVAAAYNLLAWTHYMAASQMWDGDIEGALNKGYEFARRSVSLNDKVPGAHQILGTCEVFLGRHERGLDSLLGLIQGASVLLLIAVLMITAETHRARVAAKSAETVPLPLERPQAADTESIRKTA